MHGRREGKMSQKLQKNREEEESGTKITKESVHGVLFYGSKTSKPLYHGFELML